MATSLLVVRHGTPCANRKGVKDYIATLAPFQSLSEPLLDQVVALARQRTVHENEVIFRAGDRANAFYSVRRGAVKLMRVSPDGRERVVHIINEGQNFAEAAVLMLGSFPVTAVAVAEEVELIEFNGEKFLRLLQTQPVMPTAMISSLSMRVLRLVERIEDLTISNVDCRFARHLLRLPARSSTEGSVVRLTSTKKDLAHQLGMTPETLSRVLRRMKERGVLRVRGRDCLLLDEDRLVAIADGNTLEMA